MTQAIHAHAELTAQTGTTSTSQVVKLTLTAAQLTTAGFVINDDVIVFCYAMGAMGGGIRHFRWDVQYNAVRIGSRHLHILG